MQVGTTKDDSADLLLIGAGVVQRDEAGRLVGKAAVMAYIHELATLFASVTWATSLHRGSLLFSTPLDLARVSMCLVGGRSGTLASDHCRLFRSTTKRTVIFLHLPNPWLVAPALLLRRRARALFVYVAGDYLQHIRASSRGALYRRLYRLSHEVPIRRADGVIARGTMLCERAHLLNPNVIQSIPISVPISSATQRSTDPCSRPGIEILYVGKLIKEKGIDVLLRALASLRASLPGRPLRLTVVGAGPDQPQMQRLGRELGMDDAIEYRGYVDDPTALDQLYARADLFVLPSTSEGVPRVIDEAMMHGVPVVASAVGGIPGELDGEALLVPPGDSDALAAAMQRVILDDMFRQKLLDAAAAHARQRSTQPTAASQHAQFIRQTLGGRSGSVVSHM